MYTHLLNLAIDWRKQNTYEGGGRGKNVSVGGKESRTKYELLHKNDCGKKCGVTYDGNTPFNFNILLDW